MRNFYICASFFLVLVFSGCSKDVLKSYDRRIVGTWEIVDIDRYGFSGSDNLPFSDGATLSFTNDGQVTYVFSGTQYNGSWDIIRTQQNDQQVRSLQVTVVDFSGQRVLSEYFNEIQFTGTNRFTASIYYGSRTYVYRFRR